MPILHTFFTWFSIRMGSIIVAFISLVHSVISIILILIITLFQDDISSDIRQMLDQYDFLFAKLGVAYFQENFLLVTSLAIVFMLLYVCACLILVYASYKKLKGWLIWPFIVTDFIRLLLLTSMFVIGMIILRENVLDFNIVIVCLTIGGFFLPFQYYSWLCPVSLWQCIISIEKQKRNIIEKMDTLILDNYQSDFQFKPILPNRNYFLYQYGNLPKLNT